MVSNIKRLLPAFSAILFLAAPLPAGQPEITITSPNNSVILDPGSKNNHTATIRWTSKNVSGNVAIDLFRDGENGTWETIIPSTPNTGTAKWIISGPATSLARYRVRTLSGPAASAFNNADIAIYGPYYEDYWFGGYCTAYAASEFNLVAPDPGINWVGDAGEWYNNAIDWQRTTSPRGAVPGAIGVWNDVYNLGHVAVFTGYSEDAQGIVYANFSEQNYGPVEPDNELFWDYAITENFGVVTTAQIPVSNMNRVYSATGYPTILFKFVGFILPELE